MRIVNQDDNDPNRLVQLTLEGTKREWGILTNLIGETCGYDLYNLYIALDVVCQDRDQEATGDLTISPKSPFVRDP